MIHTRKQNYIILIYVTLLTYLKWWDRTSKEKMQHIVNTHLNLYSHSNIECKNNRQRVY